MQTMRQQPNQPPKRSNKRWGRHFIAAVLLLMCASGDPLWSADAGTAEAAWKKIGRDVLDMSVDFSVLPKELYPVIERLHELHKAVVRRTPIETNLGADVEKVLQHDRIKQKFKNEASHLIDVVERAVYPVIYERLVKDDVIDPFSEPHVIFIPSPCPGMENVKKVERFMLDICKLLKGTDAQVIIVTSPYGSREVAPETVTGGSRLKDYPLIFAPYIATKLVTLLPEFPTSHDTPSGLIFEDGELLKHGSIVDWADNPAEIRRLLKE